MTNETAMTILDTVHETASDLSELGFINKRKMDQYDILCQTDLPDYDSVRIKSIRKKLKMSQTVLASAMNLSPSTIRQWEQGIKHPSGAARKLLSIIEARGIDALI